MRSGRWMLVAWLIIGALAAGQRHYYAQFDGSCAKIATIGITWASGPLNYIGLNPTANCKVPQPSK
ncbi:hypothetical protein [Actinomadura bangladeshensis]|uniref:Uncharacterized protein n=1 Tax=Actinomadura bangladeshensis TaxID=453573 RepID=A0A6L9Q986_9ACTN|nr:hypothetical protein [Actinomadura bangladeshensis]NEA21755.1 hypothetical protein [Actinomadura bangladeshensis]NED57483.1 hypothetical protein [Micromonospora aurantiaca]